MKKEKMIEIALISYHGTMWEQASLFGHQSYIDGWSGGSGITHSS